MNKLKTLVHLRSIQNSIWFFPIQNIEIFSIQNNIKLVVNLPAPVVYQAEMISSNIKWDLSLEIEHFTYLLQSFQTPVHETQTGTVTGSNPCSFQTTGMVQNVN